MNNARYSIVRESASTVRALARQALRGKWLEAFALIVIAGIIQQLPTIIYYNTGVSMGGTLVSIYSFVAQSLMMVSIAHYFLKLFRQQSCGLDDLRYGLNYMSKAIVLHLLIVIKVFLWTLLFIIPGFIAAYRYSMATYILADDPNKSPHQCIEESCEMMSGNKMTYFILMLSFIGWMILSLIPSNTITQVLSKAHSPVYLTSTFDWQVYFATVTKITYNPLVLLARIPVNLVQAYVNTAQVCFYDLANGNLSVDGYDYAAAQGYVEDPYTGENVHFKDVTVQPSGETFHNQSESLPASFEDPELKEAEDKYTR